MNKSKLFLLFILIILILSKCFLSSNPFAILEINIYSEQTPENLRVTLMDSDSLDSIKKGTKCLESLNAKALPSRGDKIVIILYDYIGNLRVRDTLYPDSGDYSIEFKYDDEGKLLLDGIYKMIYKVYDIDTLLIEVENPIVLVYEDYNIEKYNQSGLLPVFTCIPDGYNFTIKDIPVEPITIHGLPENLGTPSGLSEDDLMVETPYRIYCRDIINETESFKNIELKKGKKTTVNFKLNN